MPVRLWLMSIHPAPGDAPSKDRWFPVVLTFALAFVLSGVVMVAVAILATPDW
jgi:hypothetical protein